MIWQYHVYPFNHSQHSGRSPTLAYQTTESEINDLGRKVGKLLLPCPTGTIVVIATGVRLYSSGRLA
jgi:hypothetical protein